MPNDITRPRRVITEDSMSMERLLDSSEDVSQSSLLLNFNFILVSADQNARSL